MASGLGARQLRRADQVDRARHDVPRVPETIRSCVFSELLDVAAAQRARRALLRPFGKSDGSLGNGPPKAGRPDYQQEVAVLQSCCVQPDE